jgi:hypothetical protein
LPGRGASPEATRHKAAGSGLALAREDRGGKAGIRVRNPQNKIPNTPSVCTQMGRPSGADCSATHATGVDGTRRIIHESAYHMLHRTAASREGAAPVRVGASGAADARAGGGVAAVTVGVGAAARRDRRRRCRRRTILRSGPMTRTHGFVCSSWFSWCKPTTCLVKTDVLRG